MRNFNKTVSLGNEGKNLVITHFKSMGYTVIPIESNTSLTDFILVNPKTHKETSMFVRTDTYLCTTGNIFVERFIQSIANPDHIEYGWLFQGRADVLCVLDAVEGQLFCFKWQELKNYINEHYKPYEFRNRIDEGMIGDAYFVPIFDLWQSELCTYKTLINVQSLYKYNFQKPNPF